MLKQGIRNTQITFGIFKINRVYFMWHSRRANFPCFYFLFEIIERDISPDIFTQIKQNGIDAFHGIAKGRKAIVVFNLGSI